MKRLFWRREHIAARAVSPSVTPQPTEAEPEPSPTEDVATDLAPDEIEVDGLVMKAAVRGTSDDPRARTDEQWRIKVETTNDGRVFNVQVEKNQFEKLRAGDRVQVTYHVGKYTGTIWGAELSEK
ncbi:MAG TPA: hypothetical protein VGM62_20350 [Chthoniobacterales bacterium]